MGESSMMPMRGTFADCSPRARLTLTANNSPTPPTSAVNSRRLMSDMGLPPAVAACGQGVGLGEILNPFCLLLSRHADAAIRDGQLDPLASVRHLAHP